MNFIIRFFGESKDLTISQMCARGITVFLVALILIRISGRRSFGVRTPLDNIIVILLGAILSRAVVAASPFLPTIFTCTVIVLFHRLLGYLTAHNKFIGRLIEGEKILLYENHDFIKENMNKALVCKEDIMQGVRKSALTDDMTKIDKVYMERNGEISAIKKEI